jgi:hypothetical protein
MNTFLYVLRYHYLIAMCLVLNEWCIYDDESDLACLLSHSPILEKLSFEFFKVHTMLVIFSDGQIALLSYLWHTMLTYYNTIIFIM